MRRTRPAGHGLDGDAGRRVHHAQVESGRRARPTTRSSARRSTPTTRRSARRRSSASGSRSARSRRTARRSRSRATSSATATSGACARGSARPNRAGRTRRRSPARRMGHWGPEDLRRRTSWEQPARSRRRRAATYTTDGRGGGLHGRAGRGERPHAGRRARARRIQDRPVNLFIIGYPKPPDTAAGDLGRADVLAINCNVHGNEASGRESCFTMARQLALTHRPGDPGHAEQDDGADRAVDQRRRPRRQHARQHHRPGPQPRPRADRAGRDQGPRAR